MWYINSTCTCSVWSCLRTCKIFRTIRPLYTPPFINLRFLFYMRMIQNGRKHSAYMYEKEPALMATRHNTYNTSTFRVRWDDLYLLLHRHSISSAVEILGILVNDCATLAALMAIGTELMTWQWELSTLVQNFPRLNLQVQCKYPKFELLYTIAFCLYVQVYSIICNNPLRSVILTHNDILVNCAWIRESSTCIHIYDIPYIHRSLLFGTRYRPLTYSSI